MGVFGSGIFGSGVFGGLSALTATVQTTYPNRVMLSATGLVNGTAVTITRRKAGDTARTTVRGAAETILTDTDTIVVADWESPQGVQCTYYLTVDDADLDTELVTLTLSGSKVAISDAISGNSAEVIVLTHTSRKRDRQASTFPVGDRNITVSGSRGGFTGTIDVFVETTTAKDNLLNLIANATSGVLQIRSANNDTYDGFDAYVAVLSDDEQRWSADYSDERRIISLDVVEDRGWGSTLTTSVFTYADVATAYTGLTYLDWSGDYASYVAAAVGDYDV